MATPSLVVLIEDDIPMLTALGRLLRVRGYESASYTSAEAFLDDPPTRRPVCLVVDVNLGGMSGLELQRRLRALGSDLAVIIMTGLDEPRVRRDALGAGCVACLSKASDSGTLLDLIHSLATATNGH